MKPIISLAFVGLFALMLVAPTGNVYAEDQSLSADAGPKGELDLCTTFDFVDNQLTLFKRIFEIYDELDVAGLTVEASLALMEHVGCVYPEGSFKDATRNAFDINLSVFDSVQNAEPLEPFREFIAAAMAVGPELQSALRNELLENELNLPGNYEFVSCVETDCTPDEVEGMPLSEAYEVFTRFSKAVGDPFTGPGNPDGDLFDNAAEWANVQARQGTIPQFVRAAFDPNLDGSEVFGGGDSGVCFVATAAYGTPLVREIQRLRMYRDSRMLPSAFGALLVDGYYRTSPPIAQRIADWSSARAAVRIALVPALVLVKYPVAAPIAAALGALLLTALVLCAPLRRSRPNG